MSSAYFITGTGTNIGKTLITGFLARFISEQNKSVVTQKWIQTGSDSPDDILNHDSFSRLTYTPDIQKHRSSYVFPLAASPHLAAKHTATLISQDKLLNDFTALSTRFDYVLSEGAGGVLVPFNDKDFLIDLAISCNMGIFLVIQNTLGAIHAALSAIESIKSRQGHINGLIFSGSAIENPAIILEENVRFITHYSKSPVVADLPYNLDREALYMDFKTQAKKSFNL